MKQVPLCDRRSDRRRNRLRERRPRQGKYGSDDVEELAERSHSEIGRYGREKLLDGGGDSAARTLGFELFRLYRRPDRTRKRLHDRAFAASVDKFLAFREYKILPDKGRISKRQAEEKAVAEYDAFNKTQKIDSDFEKRLAAQNRPTRRKRKKDDE